jgi:hypothetical protein
MQEERRRFAPLQPATSVVTIPKDPIRRLCSGIATRYFRLELRTANDLLLSMIFLENRHRSVSRAERAFFRIML